MQNFPLIFVFYWACHVILILMYCLNLVYDGTGVVLVREGAADYTEFISDSELTF